MFKPFQIPYQLPISDLPQVIAANNIRETKTFMHWRIFFYNFVSSGWTNISLEGHWHFFAHNPLHQPLDLEGVLECERVLLKRLVMQISKRTLFWSWRREAKEVPETSTSHNLLCGRQCAGAHDCLANKKQKQSQLILTDGFWGYISNLKTFSQSVTDWAIQVLDMLAHLISKM